MPAIIHDFDPTQVVIVWDEERNELAAVYRNVEQARLLAPGIPDEEDTEANRERYSRAIGPV